MEVESSSGSPHAKGCPRRAEEIQAEAVVCSCCGAESQATERGYCSADHKPAASAALGNCPSCRGEAIDRSFDGGLLGAPVGGVAPAVAAVPFLPWARTVGGVLARGPSR
jgi:hypothetical protein